MSMRKKRPEDDWIPRTKLGEEVRQGLVTLDQIFQRNLVVKEKEIIDQLVKNLKEDVITIKMVQMQKASGEKSNFKAVVIVGTEGFLGVGAGKSKEVGPAIRKAIDRAKMGLIPVLRGCGSKECGCGGSHSIPFRLYGKCGSVRITLMPAPAGIGLACADKVKQVFKLCGIEDIWSMTKGDSRTSENLVKATFDAMKNAHKYNFNQ